MYHHNKPVELEAGTAFFKLALDQKLEKTDLCRYLHDADDTHWYSVSDCLTAWVGSCQYDIMAFVGFDAPIYEVIRVYL